jgi:hypothetical protein
MSPTSYQAAPPREFIIADAWGAVKRIEQALLRAIQPANTRERIRSLTAAIPGSPTTGHPLLLHIRRLDGALLPGEVCLGLVGPKNRFELIRCALVRRAVVGIAFGVAVRLRSD